MYVEILYNEHPYKFSFFGLSKMLSLYNIESKAFHFTDFEDIYLIESPFVAQFGNDFILVDSICDDSVSYFLNDRHESISLDEFKKYWTGNVLLFEAGPDSKEPDYKKNLGLQYLSTGVKTVAILAVIYCICFVVYNVGIFVPFYSVLGLFLFNLLGFFCSLSLSRRELKLSDRYGDKLCSLFRKANCNSLIESSAARIAGKYSLSAIGLGYFTAHLFFIPFQSFRFILVVINGCAILFTLWSIWYQRFKVHLYCPLCLATCLCIWGSFCVYVLSESLFIPSFHFFSFAFLCAAFIVIMYLMAMGFENMSKTREMKVKNYKLLSIKTNDLVFNALLRSQEHYETKDISQIVFGNPQGPIVVTILTNPHCQPCERMHRRICKVLEQNTEIKLVYVFSSFNDELEDSVKCLLYNYIHNEESADSIFKKWYEYGKHNRKKFYEEYPYYEDDTETMTVLSKHTEWKISNKLSATPTVLVNGYLLPQEYSVEDLINVTNID